MAGSEVEFSHREVTDILREYYPEQENIRQSWVSWGKVNNLWKPHGKEKNRGYNKFTMTDVVLIVAAREMFQKGLSVADAQVLLPIIRGVDDRHTYIITAGNEAWGTNSINIPPSWLDGATQRLFIINVKQLRKEIQRIANG